MLLKIKRLLPNMTVEVPYDIPMEGWEKWVLLSPKCRDVAKNGVEDNRRMTCFVSKKELIIKDESRKVSSWLIHFETDIKCSLNFTKTAFFAFFMVKAITKTLTHQKKIFNINLYITLI